jgi:membrane associated rhomboid family serine protease
MRYEAQVWRFITPVFLHGSFSHLAGNSLTLLLLGQLVEYDMGSWLFLFFYLLTGFGGILFSALCSDAISVGASTALFGIIGSYAANLILNWTHFKENPNKRCNILIFLLVSVFLAVGSTADPRVDQMGHFGGFITGVMSGLFLMPILEGKPAPAGGFTIDGRQGQPTSGLSLDELSVIKCKRWIGFTLTTLFLTLWMVLFYTVRFD